MATLLCFGLGYSAQHYLASYGGRFEHVWATVRDAERAVVLNSYARPRITTLAFDGKAMTADLRSAITQAEAVLVSVPPDASGDPVLTTCEEALTRAARLRTIVYLSTVGVYGNYDGAWVDEASECRPSGERNHQRYAAERAWQDLGVRSGVSVTILRLAGIYGPGRNALENVRRNAAKRVAKPGQVFNRIHVADIAQAIDAAFECRSIGVFNVADDEPTPPGDPIVFAAQLLGVEPPQEIPFAQARPAMTELAVSFYADAKRVRNIKLKSVLGVTLRYPTYREGLSALHSDGQQATHSAPAP
jgi:nucleoside-diphosphate-sugar epimerase